MHGCRATSKMHASNTGTTASLVSFNRGSGTCPADLSRFLTSQSQESYAILSGKSQFE